MFHRILTQTTAFKISSNFQRKTQGIPFPSQMLCNSPQITSHHSNLPIQRPLHFRSWIDRFDATSPGSPRLWRRRLQGQRPRHGRRRRSQMGDVRPCRIGARRGRTSGRYSTRRGRDPLENITKGGPCNWRPWTRSWRIYSHTSVHMCRQWSGCSSLPHKFRWRVRNTSLRMLYVVYPPTRWSTKSYHSKQYLNTLRPLWARARSLSNAARHHCQFQPKDTINVLLEVAGRGAIQNYHGRIPRRSNSLKYATKPIIRYLVQIQIPLPLLRQRVLLAHTTSPLSSATSSCP